MNNARTNTTISSLLACLLCLATPSAAMDQVPVTDLGAHLRDAAYDGNVALVQQLLSKGVGVDVVDTNDWTPLHFACKQGHDAVVSLLLQHHANVMVFDREDGLTPLHMACIMGREGVVNLLLQHGVAANIVDREYGVTSLHLASEMGHQGVVGLLNMT